MFRGVILKISYFFFNSSHFNHCWSSKRCEVVKNWRKHATQFQTFSNEVICNHRKPYVVSNYGKCSHFLRVHHGLQWALHPLSHLILILEHLGFPGSSASKESACNAGDPSSIPGSGRSTGEGIGYPLQYSWAFLVVQIVKNLTAMRKEKATHFSILAWRIPCTVQFMGSQKVIYNSTS